MNICYNCFYNFDGSTTCPYCGYDPAMDNGKFRNALPHGSVLNNKFILGRVIGHSVYGYTYIAEDDNADKKVVVKEYLPDAYASRGGDKNVVPGTGENGENFAFGLKQFTEEAKTLGRHKTDACIVKVSPAFPENGTSYYVVDFVKGRNLVDYMREKGGRLSWEETESIFMPIIDNIAVIQSQSVTHTEITPDNIMITPDGKVKILGFGSARVALAKKLSGKKSAFADAYSIAAAMYYALTGAVLPDQTERKKNDRIALPSQLGAVLPQGKEAAIMYALGPDSEYRYQSLEAFRKDLLTLTEAPKAPKASAAPKAQKSAPSRPAASSAQSRQGAQKKGLPKFVIPVAFAAVALIAIIAVVAGRNSGNKIETSESTAATSAVQNTEPEDTEGITEDTAAADTEDSVFETTADADSSASETKKTSRTKRTTRTTKPEDEPSEEDTTETASEDTTAPVFVVTTAATTTRIETSYGPPPGYSTPNMRTTTAPVTTAAPEPEKVEFDYDIENGGVILKKYTGSSVNIEIPRRIEGKPVKTLARNLFRGNTTIQSVSIPTGVSTIGEEAFAMCTSLVTVKIPDTVDSLGSDLFRSCSSLKNVTLPSGLQLIPARLFKDCTSLINVTIPETVTFIDSYAFCGCTSLLKITIPARVEYIAGGAFDNCHSMTRAVFKGSNTVMSLGAFTQCVSVTIWTPKDSPVAETAEKDGLPVKYN
ncbi:MAG: leucine-rich repeat protein [Ruminiclostridium sp.]|nr:leucine-rich repeat protein [Ruminiclostridium sp.]